MYNLKRGGGTYKGIIGECMFKLTRRYLILTKFFNKKKYLDFFGGRFSIEQKSFIDNHWYSIDALEFIYGKITLFEIKTLNDFYYSKLDGINRVPQFTQHTIEIYKEALRLGFDVKVAVVWLKENWDYEVSISDFDKCNYFVDGSRKYDHGAIFEKK